MIKENCPFCGHRWTRCRDQSPIICPNCKKKYLNREQLAELKNG